MCHENDIRWFVRLLQRDKRFELNNVSTFFDNVGTDKYKRVYAEVSRKKTDSDVLWLMVLYIKTQDM